MSDAKSILLIDDNDNDRQYYTHRLKVSSFAALYKSPTSGDDLDMVVHKALATIPRDHKKDATRPA